MKILNYIFILLLFVILQIEKINAQCPAPTGLTQDYATCSEMYIHWDYHPSLPTTYYLDISTNNSFTSFLPGYNNRELGSGEPTFTVNIGLTAGTTYYARIRGNNACGLSQNSTTLTCSTSALSVFPVANSGVGATTTQITANWNAASGATGYYLDVSTNSSFNTFVAEYNNLNVGNITSKIITGLTPGTIYYYRLRMSYGSCVSGNSNAIAYATLPMAPTANAGSGATSSQITANWSAVNGASGYYLDVSLNSSFTTLVVNSLNVGNVTTYNVTGLTAGTPYYYRVRAYNSSGISNNSSTISYATSLLGPTGLTQDYATCSSMSIHWDYHPSLPTTYYLDVSTSSSFTSLVPEYNNYNLGSGSPSFTINAGLAPGTTYYARIRGYNEAGLSPNSSTLICTTSALPASPIANAGSGATTTQITANWGAVSSVSGYYLDVSTSSSFASTLPQYGNLDMGTVTTKTITGLTAGTIYYYRVRSYTGSCASVNSGTISYATLPVAPTANAGSGATSTQITANWNAVSGATGYYLDVSTSSSFNTFVHNNLNVGNVITKTITGLTAGTTYYYRIRAYNGSGSSAYSSVITYTTVVSAPTANAGSGASTEQITANWSAVSGATGYYLDVSTNSSFNTFVAEYNNLNVSNVTTKAITGLTAGTTYYYRVRAYTGTGVSVNSNTIAYATLPIAPTANAGSGATSSQITANWSSVSGATGYYLDVSTSSSFNTFVLNNLNVGNVVTYNATGLSGSTAYYYRVRAYNSSGVSTNSSTIMYATILSGPTGLTLDNATCSTMSIHWDYHPTLPTNYYLDVSTSSSFTNILPEYNNYNLGSSVSSFTINIGLTPGTTYYVRIRGANAAGLSPNSTLTCSTNTLPTAPTANAGSGATTTQITANWGAVSGATGYYLDVSTSSSFASTLPQYNNLDMGVATTKTIIGLTAGTTYYYRVRSYTGSCASVNSGVISYATLPTAPTSNAGSGATSSQITANWSAVSGATGYYLDVSLNSSFTSLVVNNLNVGNVTAYNVTGLTGTTVYYYRVRAYNGSGSSANSSIITYRTVLPVPTGLTQDQGNCCEMFLRWETTSGATGYYVDVSTNSSFLSFVNGYNNLDIGNVTAYIINSNLTPGNTYYVRVRAHNETVTSDNSSILTCITTLLPPSPKGFKYDFGTLNQMFFHWDATSCAEGYYLDLSMDDIFTSFVPGYQGLDLKNVTQYTINSGLTPNTTYYARIRAYNVKGAGTNSKEISCQTTSTPLPPIALEGSDRQFYQITANWTPVLGATGYYLDVWSNNTSTLIETTTTICNNLDVGNVTSKTITGLTLGTTYYYRVRARVGSYVSLNSNIISCATSKQANMNYIMSRTILKDNVKDQASVSLFNEEEMQQSTTYYDGLGRPVQNVIWLGSPSKHDIVQPFAYDENGREPKKYLPYTDGIDGIYKVNALGNPLEVSNIQDINYKTGQQYKYYRGIAPVSDTYPYSESTFDNSPLNRVIEQREPGYDWRARPYRITYKANSRSNAIVIWKITDTGFKHDGFYNDNELFVTETYMYNSASSTKLTKEYKDKEGKVILKRNSSDVSNPNTYYIYDDFGRLAYVTTPVANDQIYAVSEKDVNFRKYIYAYKYDDRDRMIAKHIPGTGWIFMIYDNRDRLVLTQDSAQRVSSKWMFTKYDNFNRPVLTGFVYTEKSRVILTNEMAAYDENYNEIRTNSGVIGYTLDNSFKNIIPITEADILTVTYYDDHGFKPVEGFADLGYNNIPGYNATHAYGASAFDRLKGLVTGSKIKVLDGKEHTSDALWLNSISYYDAKYRVIQVQRTLYDGATGGKEIASTLYDFIGKVLETKQSQTFGTNENTVARKMTYDHAGRLKKTEQSVNNEPYTTTSELVYNELGQLADKKLHGGQQSIDYTYNIRGWLSQINNPDNLTADANDTYADLFAMRLNYQKTEPGVMTDIAQLRYDGNITSMVWNASGKGKQGYAFTYDGLDRLKGSDYKKYNTTTLAWEESQAYEEKGITYDKNGNILTLQRTNVSGVIQDNFTYTYNGNQLSSLTNTINGIADTRSYVYDGNGNAIKDGLRGFDVSYNLLNLPKGISKSTDNIAYIYSAAGEKLAKKLKDNTYQYYAGSMVYNNDKALSYALFEEGRVTKQGSSFTYEYHLKDHLGNTRVSFQPGGSGAIVLQVAEYYPFGSSFKPTEPNNDNKYLYNGKEKQDDVLSGTALDWYDYGARFYDPVIGRWHSVDPLIQFPSPYIGLGNNPICLIDPTGMAVKNTANGIQFTGDDAIEFFLQLKNANSGSISWGDLWNKIDNAVDVGYFPEMMGGVNCRPSGKNTTHDYNREEGPAYTQKRITWDSYNKDLRQKQKDEYMARFNEGRAEWAKGTFGLMGTIIAVPFLTTQASVDYFVAKGIGSVFSQLVTGKVDVVDVAADALLKPGSGALLSGLINADLTRDGFQVSTNSTQDMLLVTGSTFVFNGAGGLFENATGSAFKGTQNGAAAAGITYGVTSFMTSTLNSITQYITK